LAIIKDNAKGIIIFYEFPRSRKYLLIKHKKGHWSFAKGHKEKAENSMQTAIRELYEETGIKNIEFLSKKILLKDKYIFTYKENEKVIKTVDYFIAKSNTKKVKIDNKEIVNFKWCTLKPAIKTLTFKQSKSIIKKADKIIFKKYKIKKS